MAIRKRKAKKSKNGYTYQVYFNYKYKGITKQYSKSGFYTKKEAQEHEAQIRTKIMNGEFYKTKNKTIHEVYMELLDCNDFNHSKNTERNNLIYYNRYIHNQLGNMYINEVSYKDIYDVISKIEYYNSKQKIKFILNSIFIYGIKNEYCKYNPTSNMKFTNDKKNTDAKMIITLNEIDMIANDINNMKIRDTCIKNSLILSLYIGYYTGLRIGEVFALNNSDIDLLNDTITVNKQLISRTTKQFELSYRLKSKSSYSKLPLAKPLKDMLTKWIFNNPSDHLLYDSNYNYISPKHMQNVVNRLGYHFNFHSLRHTFATNLYMNNVDIKSSQELLRHASVSTTLGVYTHISDDVKKDSINTVFKENNAKKPPIFNSDIKAN